MNQNMLSQILKDRKRKTRSLALILCLSMVVSLGTFAGFHKTAQAKVYTKEVLDCPYAHEGAEPVAHVHNDDCYEGETLVCTLPEREAHTHTDECFTEQRVLVCGLEENPGHQHSEECYDENGELICQIPEGEGAHAHTDACYTIERVLVCNQPELPVHVHDAGCFHTEEISVDEPEETVAPEQTVNTVPEMPVSDPNADLETASDWEKDFENLELSGNWARDLVLVAATQQGRGESPNNFEAVLNDAGDAWVRHGYTRYGAWYGVPYAEEWSAMFVSFCLRYAGIPEENVPNNPTAAFMAESFSNGELFAGRDYVPAVGDLIFFDTVIDDEITNIDHMGIVYYVDEENGTINTVEGDRSDAVATFGYHLDDEEIVGYGILPQNPDFVPAEDENEEPESVIVVTTEEEENEAKIENEETKDTVEETAPAVPMPAQSWERTAGGIKVLVEAPEGAFPENTRIAVTPVNGNSLKDTVSDAVNGEVLEVQAVDITFFDAEGHEIEPAVPIRVVMTPAATENAEEKTSVVHVDIAQQTAELVEQAVGTEFDNSEVVFDADAFTIYAIVYTVDFEYEVNGKIYTSSMPGAQDIALQTVLEALGVHTNTEKVYANTIESFMGSVANVASTDESVVSVGTDWTIRVLKDGDAGLVITMKDGAVFTVKVSAEGETSVEAENVAISTVGDLYLPAEAEAKAKVVDGEEAIEAVKAENETATETEYTVFDITLANVDTEKYKEGFEVTVALDSNITGKDFRLYHVHDGVMDDITESLVVDGDANEDGTKTVTGFSFRTGEFSEFVLSYTVDFQFGEYEYHMMGWTSLPLSDLLSALRVVEGDASAFLEKVSDVTFSDPSLLRVTHLEYPTTVAIVEESIFNVVFPDAETEVRSDRELNAGEWLLTSLAPFSSEEALTVTMKNGQQFVIDVFDAQEVAGNNFITDAQLTIDGTTYGKDETWHVYPDVGYTMKLTFAEKGSNQFPKGGDTIVVDLPAGLTIAEDGHHTFDIPAGLAGTITGNEYWVQNGKLYVKFGEDPEDILTRSSNAHFNINFIAKFDEGTSQISFNDKVKPNIEMDNETDVSVSKSASYNSATGKMDYTITVRSTGNSENVQVHDALTNTNLLTIDTSSITVSPSGTSYTLTNSSTSGFDMTIPSIGHNETVTIKYSADVNESALNHNGTVKVSDDGKNTVTVDDHTAETHTNQIKYSNTSKSSTSVEDHETEKTATLGWKIVLNDNYRGSIVGDKVTDTIDWSSKDAMKYSNPLVLTINAKNQDGSKTYTNTVTINQDDITNNQGQQSWSYIIPPFEDPNEILSYEITYTTEVDKTKLTDPNGIVKNNTDNEGDDGSTGTGVVPVTPPEEDKIVGGKSATDVTEEYVDWDIVINVPPEGFTDGLTVTDYIPMAPQYGGLADKFDSILSVTGLVGDETYTVDCISTDLNEDGSVNWNLRNNNSKRDIVTIVFYQDADKTQQGLTATTQARTVTIKIRTINDPKWLDYIDEHGSGDPNSYYHTNIARANNTTFEGKAAPQRSKIDKKLIGESSTETAPDGMPVYQYAVDLAGVKSLPVVIEDTFNPDELEYYAYWYGTDNHQYIDGQPQQHMLNNGIAPYKATITEEDGKIIITADDLPKKENGDFWEYYRIYYKLKIKNQQVLDSFRDKALANGGTYIVRNNAVWNGTDDHVDIEFTVPTVEKTGSFRINQGESGNNRLYDFAIDINKECLKLNAGEPMDLTDTHTDNLTVDYTTVKVYRYDGETKTLDTSIQWNFNGNIGTFYNLQDETHYTIEYSCLVIGSATQAFSNYAEMNGYHAEKHDSRDFGNTIDAGADVFQIGLIKYKNGMTSLGLGGATFQLFRGTGSFHEVTNGTYTWKEEDRIPMTWGVGTETTGKVGQNITFTTDSTGYVLIALDQTHHGAELEEGVHYFLKEIESPPGYQIDSSVEYWEFTLTMDPDEVCYGTQRDQYGNRLWIYFYYDDILKMNNTKTDEPITVKVDKEWFNIEGNKIANPDQTAKVQLYQKKNNEDYQAVGTITVGDTTYDGLITLPVDGKWEYKWENLPRVDTDGNAYAYKLEEVEIPEDFVSTSSLTETDNEKSYHLENYQVTERNVNVSVSKQWFDENGTTPISVDDLPEDLTEIQFYLYRVVSRAPFTTAPTSGGNPYNIDGNQYLVTGSKAEPGLYKISREQFSDGISFIELPSVHKEDGVWYFYSYYVKEVPVEGYSASVSVEEGTDAQNNTILLRNPMKNKKKPEERTTDLEISKKWKDKGGNDKTWPANTTIQFKLYQVTSTKPFEETPKSGGTLYDVKKDPYNYHDNRVGEGTYKIENGSPITFSGLPEVTIDVNDKATYYAYYVNEVEVTGYETEYVYDASVAGKVSILMTNKQEPDYTQLSVEKKWFDGDTEITDQSVLNNLSATVELVRYRAVPNGTMVHFYRFSNGHFVKIDNSDLLVKSSTQNIGIHFSGLTGGANAYYGSDASALTETETYKVNQTHAYVSAGYVQPTHGENITITTGAEQDLYVVFYNDVSFASAETNKPATDSGVASIDTTFDSSAYQITLDQSNSFAHTYAKLLTSETVGGQTYVYTYGVREVSNPTGFEFDSYSVDTNDEDTTEGIHASVPGTGTIIVKNKKTEDQTGALKFTKNVTVNSEETTTTLADGDYTFSVAGPGEATTIVKYVRITVTNGKAVSYKVVDGPTEPTDWSTVPVAETFADDAVTREAVVSGLDAGDYTITEEEVTGMTTTVSGGKEHKNNETARTITVTVTPGDTVEATAQAVFTNDKQLKTFNFNKIWLDASGSVDNPSDFQKWQKDITVTIGRRVSSTVDNKFALKYTITKSGDTFTATMDTTASTLPTGEGNLTDLILTATSSDNVFNFALPDDSLRTYDNEGNEWEYYVAENQIDGYAPPKYGTVTTTEGTSTYSIKPDAQNAGNGGLIVNQTFGGYALPQTGGIGTKLFTALGGLMTVTAGAILTLRRTASRRRGEKQAS